MASIIRKGNIPYAPTGIGEYVDEIYTVKGFHGDWAHLYRKRNLAHPKSWSDDKLMYSGIDGNALAPSDATDPQGEPLTLATGDDISFLYSMRSQAMPFAEKNVEYHQIRFYHKGQFLLETEMGPLEVGPGDFVVIPKGLIFRETPTTEDNAILIFESKESILLAEKLWDSVGYASLYVDYSQIELPTPEGVEEEVETQVRVKYEGQYHTMEYDFDPCKDVVGWLGDPVVFKFNVWQVPGIGTTSGFLPPPANAVLYGENLSFFFNVLGPRPLPTSPPPDASFGAPSHLNDYDEVWFNHAAQFAPDTDGHFWLFPRTLPHPGLKRPPEYPENPVQQQREMKLNFDTKAKLEWTPEAKKALLPDARVSVYTSFYGAHIGVVPDEAARYAKT